MNTRVLSLFLAMSVAPAARAATCNVNGCFGELAAAPGVLVHDVFRDANGQPGTNAPQFGQVINPFPMCVPERLPFAGAGQSLAPFDCPGQYMGLSTTPTVENARVMTSKLDRLWYQPCRLADATQDAMGCLQNLACIADDVGGNFLPWAGLVFDLRAAANGVAVFAQNDHGPQPCESLEYTIFLTDNPFAHAATDIVLDPATQGVNPMKWNRAKLSKVYTKGWVEVRPPDAAGHAACGDTVDFSVEEDSFVSVYSLPCGVSLKYAAVVAGNDGLDFPSCAYLSSEGEVDAVVGLTAAGAMVCPDQDNDGFMDCNCPGADVVCDCDDQNLMVHPGATEACDAPDLNCDGTPGTCSGMDACLQSQCVSLRHPRPGVPQRVHVLGRDGPLLLREGGFWLRTGAIL